MFLALSFIVLLVCVLISVAFITLLERSVLGYIQLRKGPNKVGFIGVIQPISDAVKLFSKEPMKLKTFNGNVYLVSPVIMLVLMLTNWVVYPFMFGYLDFSLAILFFLCVISMGVYVLLGCGWSANSKFGLLGALRGIAQTISYEVSLAVMLLGLIVLVGYYSVYKIIAFQFLVGFVLILFPVMLMWVVTMLAETNRTPFDLSEGESELVSGFNVEYSSGMFAMLFMGEYGMIIFMSVFLSVLFFGTGVLMYWVFISCVVLIIWLRGTLPRVRYDKLMKLAWTTFLPVGLNMLCFCVGVSVMSL